VRVPMLMHWPAHAGCAAWADSGQFTHLDLVPTLAAIAGAKVPFNADGNDRSADLFPTAHSPSGSCRSYAYADTAINEIPQSEAVFLEVGYGRGVVVGKWKLVRVPRPARGGGGRKSAREVQQLVRRRHAHQKDGLQIVRTAPQHVLPSDDAVQH
jgi:arylsulfatase A-like enzyme